LIAFELAKLLEKSGKKGKIVLIDGAPQFLKKLVVDQMPTSDTDEGVQAVLISGLLRSVFPEEKIDAFQIMKDYPTWDERIDHLVEIGKDQYLYTVEYLRTMAYCLFKRIKMVIEYESDKTQSIRSPITLIRPTEISIVDVEEDYGLQKLTRGEVLVKYVTGNHLTMLENPKVVQIIHETNPVLQSNISFKKQHVI
jgi:fatty acid synthase, animal type